MFLKSEDNLNSKPTPPILGLSYAQVMGFFTLAILCQIIFSSKSHFVQPNVVCPNFLDPWFLAPVSQK